MDEIEQTLFALDNLARTKKTRALGRRDEILAEQIALRNRWKLRGDDIISPKNQWGRSTCLPHIFDIKTLWHHKRKRNILINYIGLAVILGNIKRAREITNNQRLEVRKVEVSLW